MNRMAAAIEVADGSLGSDDTPRPDQGRHQDGVSSRVCRLAEAKEISI